MSSARTMRHCLAGGHLIYGGRRDARMLNLADTAHERHCDLRARSGAQPASLAVRAMTKSTPLAFSFSADLPTHKTILLRTA